MEVDLRSDTVTRPTPGMMAAMQAAPVGDDVFADDPTVNRLQERVAAMFGKEAALFMPSGTMSNQIALRVHCQPGDEFICDVNCHIYYYEQGAFAQLSGLVARTVEGEFGIIQPRQLHGLQRPDNDHCVRTKLLCLENTHNRGSGRIYPWQTMVECVNWAREHGIATHLDGARLFNAIVATGITAQQYGTLFDTISICFSKGLGCPVGSMLIGSHAAIKLARRYRKLFGGAMRQVGLLAAAADYALDQHVARLADDQRRAQDLARFIQTLPGTELRPATIDSNIVIFAIDPSVASAARVVEECRELGLLMLAVSPTTIRTVTHLDFDDAQLQRAQQILAQVWQLLGATPAQRTELPASGGKVVTVA
jgi:threonine aldolase